MKRESDESVFFITEPRPKSPSLIALSEFGAVSVWSLSAAVFPSSFFLAWPLISRRERKLRQKPQRENSDSAASLPLTQPVCLPTRASAKDSGKGSAATALCKMRIANEQAPVAPQTVLSLLPSSGEFRVLHCGWKLGRGAEKIPKLLPSRTDGWMDDGGTGVTLPTIENDEEPLLQQQQLVQRRRQSQLSKWHLLEVADGRYKTVS